MAERLPPWPTEPERGPRVKPGSLDAINQAVAALHHAHGWLERVDTRAEGYFGLDHKVGENNEGCTLCSAVVALAALSPPPDKEER